MSEYEDEDSRTIFCANVSDKVTEELLYELFLQGGPIEKVAQPKDKEGRARSFAFVTYVHAISVPYAVNLFQGTQLFNRELTIKPRNNNNSNAPHRVDNPMSQQSHPFTMNNPFETKSKFCDNGSNRFDRNSRHQQNQGNQYEQQQSSLRSGFNPIPTKASMQMQPQPQKRFHNQQQGNASEIHDLNKLILMGSNMLQSNNRQTDASSKPAYDSVFAKRQDSDRHANNLKMTGNRHNSRSHYRDEPYSCRDPPRHQHRSNSDRRRR